MMLSIILPVYNVEKYLARCIHSLIKQLDDNDEIIIVDDGAKDHSGIMAEEFSAEDRRIRVYHKENGGLASARNYGLAKATGDFVTFVDPDDFVCDDYAEQIKDSLTGEEDVLGFGFYRMRDKKIIGCLYSNVPEGEYTKDAIKARILPEAICKKNIIGKPSIQGSACTYAYRRAFLLENGLSFRSEREIINEDYLFNLNVLVKAKRLSILRRALYCYDTREGSLSLTYHPNIYATKQMLFSCYEKTLLDMGLLDEMRQSLNGFWILCIYECIIDAVWKYSTLTPKEQVQKVDGFLHDGRLQTVIREYPKSALGLKGKLIISLMRRRAAYLICKGYRAFEKLKEARKSIKRHGKYEAAISPLE